MYVNVIPVSIDLQWDLKLINLIVFFKWEHVDFNQSLINPG